MQCRRYEKNRDFRLISRFISEMVVMPIWLLLFICRPTSSICFCSITMGVYAVSHCSLVKIKTGNMNDRNNYRVVALSNAVGLSKILEFIFAGK